MTDKKKLTSQPKTCPSTSLLQMWYNEIYLYKNKHQIYAEMKAAIWFWCCVCGWTLATAHYCGVYLFNHAACS